MAPRTRPTLAARPPRPPPWAGFLAEQKDANAAATWFDYWQPMALATAFMLIALTMPPRKDQNASHDWFRRWACRLMYALTTVNPLFSVISNDYTFARDAASSYIAKMRKQKGLLPVEPVESLRRTVTGIRAIKPRRLFAAGATMRGIQLHSPLRRFFDPPAHFGAGINLLALFDGVAWPASFTLGWAVSEPFWTLGAEEESRGEAPDANEPPAAATASQNASVRKGAPPASDEPTHSTPPAQRHPWNGLRMQVVLSSIHLELITILLARQQVSWALLVLCAAGRWGSVQE